MQWKIEMCLQLHAWNDIVVCAHDATTCRPLADVSFRCTPLLLEIVVDTRQLTQPTHKTHTRAHAHTTNKTVTVHLFSKQTADIRPLSDSSQVLPATEHNTPFILTGKRVQQCLVFTAKCALKNYSKCGSVINMWCE